jgi:RNA polymerase sigma-70 factor, ECF subfamily
MTAIHPAVLDRARSGDQEAFTALVRHYDPGLRGLAFRLLGDRERMDDALQETYVKAFRALPRFRGDSALGTWLYRIAYNACLDELERSRRAPVVPIHELPEHQDPQAGPAETLSRSSDLARALAALPPPDRAAVLLGATRSRRARGSATSPSGSRWATARSRAEPPSC